MFVLFCIFYIAVVYLQLNVSDCYQMNRSIKGGIEDPSLTSVNETEKFIKFSDINVEEQYLRWLR